MPLPKWPLTKPTNIVIFSQIHVLFRFHSWIFKFVDGNWFLKKLKRIWRNFPILTQRKFYLSDEKGYILTRCMFDCVLLNLVTAEKSQVILRAACGKEAEMITVYENLVLWGSTVWLIIAVIVSIVKIVWRKKFVTERKTCELRTCKWLIEVSWTSSQ